MSLCGTNHVADTEEASPSHEFNPLELAVALYAQGRSDDEVSDLMGVPIETVNGLVRVAGVMRDPREVAQVANRRWTGRERVARLDIAALVERWLDQDNPTEVEDLAREFFVPADLLWDALAEQLSREPSNGVNDDAYDSGYAA